MPTAVEEFQAHFIPPDDDEVPEWAGGPFSYSLAHHRAALSVNSFFSHTSGSHPIAEPGVVHVQACSPQSPVRLAPSLLHTIK